MKKLKSCKSILFMLIKYVFSMIIPALVVLRGESMEYLEVAFGELLLILLLTEGLCYVHRTAAWLVNSVLLLLLNVQYAILYFGSTFLSLSMVDNLSSIQDISGKFYIYIPLVLLVLIINFLPVTKWPGIPMRSGMFTPGENKRKMYIALCILTAGLYVFFGICGSVEKCSPYYAVVDLVKQKREVDQMRAQIQAQIAAQQEAQQKRAEEQAQAEAAAANAKREGIMSNMGNLSGCEFFHTQVDDLVSRPENLPENPNVILIFMEGTSQVMAEDERDIMPNLRQLEEEGLYFSNYYNHTFATYMGLSGQLYSGYQQSNTDPNVLLSLQDLLCLGGYHTAFINTEPKNEEFTVYLQDFDFDELITSDQLRGKVESVSDRDAFQLLYDTAVELDREEEPFFLSIYTFGTHVNLDSPDTVYGDGSNATLNRAANADIWLGEFLEQFKGSSLAKNTLLIVTADHAAYKDADYKQAFSKSNGTTSLDRIPLVFYYDGIQSETVDARGRNSLDLAPTILDYLDISNGNCFLGNSLYGETDANGQTKNYYETTFYSVGVSESTAGSSLANLPESRLAEFEKMLEKYFVLKLTGTL